MKQLIALLLPVVLAANVIVTEPVVSTNDVSFTSWQGSPGFDLRGISIQRTDAVIPALNMLAMGGLGQINMNTARGTLGSPTITQNGDGINIRLVGYNGTTFSPQAAIAITAVDNWIAETSYPTRTRITATPTGSTSSNDVADFEGSLITLHRDVVIKTLIEGTEQASAPAAPAANGFRLYAKDNGSGKTVLYVRFASGAEQQVAIEP